MRQSGDGANGGSSGVRSGRAAGLIAPWSPAENLYCGMGYGLTPPDRPLAAMLLPLLGLRHPDLASRPLPWQSGAAARAEYLTAWRSREWYSWLRDRLQFPFHALVMTSANRLQVKQVTGLVSVTPERARQFGIYFEVPMGKEVLVAGATAVTPFDITSPNLLPIYEYHAYRARVGPPPGMRGQPTFMTL